MKRAPVASSSLRSLGYDAAQQVLEVEFASGALYRYEQVPAADGASAAAGRFAGPAFQSGIQAAALPLPAHRMNGRRGG